MKTRLGSEGFIVYVLYEEDDFKIPQINFMEGEKE